jgi:hypothetical protein
VKNAVNRLTIANALVLTAAKLPVAIAVLAIVEQLADSEGKIPFASSCL